VSQLGLCVSYPAAMPERAELEALGPDLIRIFTYSFSELDRALAELPSGVQVVVTINGEWAEVQQDYSGWIEAARDFGPRFQGRVQYIALGNEWDLWHLEPPIGAPDPKLTPEWSARMAADVAAIYAEFGMQPILPSVASGQWPHYLDRMVAEYKRLTTVPAWADLHLYVKSIAGHPARDGWQEAGAALRAALDIAQMPVCSTEGGIKVGDAGGADAHAEWTRRFVHLAHSLNPAKYPFVSLFCHSDRGGAPGEQWDHGFGLRTPNLTQRPAWQAFKTASDAYSGESAPRTPQEVPTVPQQFTVGPGVLAEMGKHQDTPATDEVYFPPGAPAGKSQWSQTIGQSGAWYVYTHSNNATHRFPPDQ